MSVHHLREALLFLALAGILVPVLQRLRVNQMLGFLVAGILFGPHGISDWAGGAPWLTLVTCKLFDEQTNTYRWRVVVRAALVDIR